MSSSVALKVAGQVFERLRADGEPLEAAMREAERTLNAAREAARVPGEATGPVPPFATGVLAQVAQRYRVTVENMQFRGGARDLVEARDEAAYLLVRLGLSYTQSGRLLRRDRYVAIASFRRFEATLKLGPVPRARIEAVIARWLALKAYEEASAPRRPPACAGSSATDLPVNEGSV